MPPGKGNRPGNFRLTIKSVEFRDTWQISPYTRDGYNALSNGEAGNCYLAQWPSGSILRLS